jgi:neutral ceramidase
MRLYPWVASLLLVVTLDGRADDLRAGAAKIDITPPLGFAMWGYGARHDAPSVGVLDPLQARALVLRNDTGAVALVSLDLGRAPTRKYTSAIRARVKKEVGIEHLFLVGSHTHHGPVLEVDTWPTPENSYDSVLAGKLADVIVQAAGKARPARLGVAAKEVPFNRNRHSKLAEKPVDRSFTVMRVEDLDGKPIAVAVNFAAHPTMLSEKIFKFSADYPGALAGTVEQETGVPCLFLQGGAGDLSPNADEFGGPDRFGTHLGKLTLDMLKGIACDIGKNALLQTAEEDFRFRSRVNLQNPFVKAAFVRAFFKDLVDFYDQEYRDGVRPHLSVALLNKKVGFVGVSGEFFCSHSLELKRRARLDHVLFLGYCNDYQQYFPTIEAAAQSGYGADPGVANAEVGAGETMMNHALIQLYRMRDRFPDMRGP